MRLVSAVTILAGVALPSGSNTNRQKSVLFWTLPVIARPPWRPWAIQKQHQRLTTGLLRFARNDEQAVMIYGDWHKVSQKGGMPESCKTSQRKR